MANYNGVEMPDIDTVWADKETFKYALMLHKDNSVYELLLSTLPLYVTNDGYIAVPENGYTDTVHYLGKEGNFITGYTDAWLSYAYSLNAGVTSYSQSELHWSTYSVKGEDGTIYPSDSDHVPVIQSYLYNGVELPALPEWDIVEYPYAIIGENIVEHDFMLMLSETPFIAEHDGTYENSFNEVYVCSGGEWQSSFWPGAVSYVWTNTDVLKEDGSVFFTASCPTDAETGEEFHGWCLHPVPVSTKINLTGWRVKIK